MKRNYKKAVEALCAAQKILIVSHVNPDGDTLGCVLAMTHVLRALGKDAVPISTDGVPEIYAWMPGADLVQTGTDRRDFELAIICDAGALERTGRSQLSAIESAPLIVNIDHHLAEAPFGDIRIVDETAAATAELIYDLIRALSAAAGCTLMTTDIAKCLMTGLITDTGSFRFMNVTPRTFYLAARLQRYGALPAPIAELIFENRSYGSLKLQGRALASLQTTDNGNVAWAHITAEDFAQLDVTDADTEGIVNQVRSVQGAQIGVLFREIPGKKVRVSLRAREGADVNKIAAVFGGGGHRLASGCSLDPPLTDVERAVVAECVLQLRAQGSPP